jgi:hypothetical protein
MPQYAPGQVVRSKAHGIVQIRYVEKDSMVEDLVQYLVELSDGSTTTITGINLVEGVNDPSFNQRHRAALGALIPLENDLLLLISQFAGEVMKVGDDYVALDPEILAGLSRVNRFFRDLVSHHRQRLGFHGAEVRALRATRSDMLRNQELLITLSERDAVQATCEKLLENDLLAIQRVARYILTTFPPDEYLYVGLGGSPTPVTAYLRVCGRNARVVDVPASALSQHLGGEDEIWDSEEARGRVIGHLDRYLGAELTRNTQLLIIDYSTGTSLLVAEYLLRRYLEQRYDLLPAEARERVLPLAINDGLRNLPAERADSRLIRIMLEEDPLFTQLLNLLNSELFKIMSFRQTDSVSLHEIAYGKPDIKTMVAGYQDLCAQLRTFLKRYRDGSPQASSSASSSSDTV